MLIKFFATYRQIAGCKSFTLESKPETVRDLLDYLGQRWPEFKPLLLSPDGHALGPDAIVMVNGRHIDHLQGVDTPLKDEDAVAVLPLVAGG